MADTKQYLVYVKKINETLNKWSANAKKTEELPEMVKANPEALLIASELESGIWTSKKIEIKKIIEEASDFGQNNNVREVILGVIDKNQDLNYLLDTNGITVSKNEIVILTALATVDSTLIQHQYLWKLGKGAFNPIGSSNINDKLIALQPRFISELTANELTSSPGAVVYDLGAINTSILETINNITPAKKFTDQEKIYYIRCEINGVNLLYNFIGINGNYGSGELQMIIDDLVLIYSSANTDLFSFKQDKNQKNQPNGYVGLESDTKIAAVYLNIINNLTQGGAAAMLSAEMGKQLGLQLDAIRSILFSDNINLDTIQEIVDVLENVQTYIDNVLVNDLTTGGVTKALTAEMGKQLKNLLDNKANQDGTGAMGTWGIDITGSAKNLKPFAVDSWKSSSLPMDFADGVSCSFVSRKEGFPHFGSVVNVKTIAAGGGSLQLYVPYSSQLGGDNLKVRFGNYGVNNGNSWTAWKTLANLSDIPDNRVLAQLYTNVSTTDTVFTTLFSYTMPANTLAKDGDFLKITVNAIASLNNSDTSMELSLGGVVMHQFLNNSIFVYTYTIIRNSSTTVAVFFNNSPLGTLALPNGFSINHLLNINFKTMPGTTLTLRYVLVEKKAGA
ncbi:hypothetical protein [Flavobacterium crassostreae]|uniref:Uncharacterized protein n=1 Tax=Flavobacterium crassostreae TaxID=1763534 RepID=A0A1B9E7L6_9FLAO|nr:hypothetical protein [Flavobacterium crassostreae]OCB77945.1 hypothetical protein LPBF_03085 [Flavobacterium crassostreae]